MWTPAAIGLLILLAAGCRGGARTDGAPSDAASTDAASTDAGGDASSSCTSEQLADLEQQMSAILDAAALDLAITSDPDLTVLLETGDGRRYTHAHGGSTTAIVYESASTSKWVSAVIILDLVDRGLLTLDTTANELLPYWAETAVDPGDLLSFTSGFAEAPAA